MEKMNIPALTVVDLHLQAKESNSYTNFPLNLVNDHVVRMSIMTEPFYWHFHPNSDESFLVVEGSLCIDLETHTVELFPGQLFTIPENTRHRTRPKGERSVNLTFESQNMETIKIKIT